MAIARILLQKETVLDLMGDIEGALAVLAEAAPLVEAAGNRHLLFSLRFNMAVDLCHLERYAEAAALLPRVRELAIEQANELDLLRLVWLEARIDAGQGRARAAQAGLEQVRRKFADLEMPYDAALASLDLAVALAEGRPHGGGEGAGDRDGGDLPGQEDPPRGARGADPLLGSCQERRRPLWSWCGGSSPRSRRRNARPLRQERPR